MNNYFCVLPFFSYESSSQYTQNIYCCRLPPGTNIQDVQQSIKNKERSPACNTCWKLEDQGLESERKTHNRTFDYYADRDLELIEQDAITNGFTPKIIKLATSNLCNATCITCGAHSSTAWAKLENRPIEYAIADTTAIDFKDIVQLSFVGGEPLLEKRNFDILKELISFGNTNCFISIVTNGSIELSQQQLSILSQFKNLNICLSIDGTGDQFNYVRWPLKWDQLQYNLDQFKQMTQHISVSCMISNLNVLYYSKLIEFFESNQLKYLCKQIVDPEYFAPGNLPEQFKQQVLKNNRKYHNEVSAFLSYGKEMFEKFWEEIDRQDQLKGIDIKDYLPELAATRI
jgi:sulfatase maturation enzyme AslB (radical SAM superfamily)